MAKRISSWTHPPSKVLPVIQRLAKSTWEEERGEEREGEGRRGEEREGEGRRGEERGVGRGLCYFALLFV